MMLLTPENKTVEINNGIAPRHYAVLDASIKKDVDFRFPELLTVEIVSSYGIRAKVGDYEIELPATWSILCSDGEKLFTIPIYTFRARTFDALVFNPITGTMFDFWPCRMGNVVPIKTWASPEHEDKKYLALPLHSGENPPCIYARYSKREDVINIGDLM